ncbi:c-type cytochrome [Paenibacillus methanolicus]|uniref:Cytochrome c551 n=1 Tax=Paenibacillus methanolicus TaxID=582686 RepID=A0A5S5BXV9_9BACL|nr:cytochrome c [Paenibacillus methanolicus]TYP71877.1 cytochrome c551 [Paenibacillus methanolicus]
MNDRNHPSRLRPLARPIARLSLAATAAAALLLASGCGGGSGGQGGAASAELTGPAETLTLYRNNCVNCHGAELQGRMGAVTNLAEVGSRMSEAEIEAQIKSGSGAMPAFAERLTEEEIKALASWLAGHK